VNIPWRFLFLYFFKKYRDILVVCLTCHTMPKKILSHLSTVSHSNPTSYFDMAKKILSYFYKLLTGGIKLVD
jgi:hypothetical protein